MRRKYVLGLSIAINVLVVAGLLFLGLKNREYKRKSIMANREAIQGLIIQDSLSSAAYQGQASDFKWPAGKQMALSITFDDALISQIDNGVPLLDKYGVKATFYASIWNLEQRLDKWKRAISNGHEVGNHTYMHPCSINKGMSEDMNLEDYTLPKMSRELYFENSVIKDMVGVEPVSFAYPCGQTFIGRGLDTKSYVPLIAAQFESGRGLEGGSTNPTVGDMSQLTGENLDGKSFDQIKTAIETARKKGKWLILAGHEIGGEPSDKYKVSYLETIEKVCKYVNDPANGIWVDNVHNISSYIREQRGEGQFVKIPIRNDLASSITGKMWSEYYFYRMKLKSL